MKCAVIFVFAITLGAAVSLTLRHKRQSDDDENNLDDRYGWNRPQPSWNNQNWQDIQGPGRPRPNNQRPNQWPDQGNQQPGDQWQQGGNQFPNQGGNGQNQQQNQWPGPNQGGQTQPTQAPSGNGGTTTQSSAVQECIRNCPVTSEYNPVCGSNMVQYPNPGRLTCAQNCGVNVSLFRSSACPVTTTVAPAS